MARYSVRRRQPSKYSTRKSRARYAKAGAYARSRQMYSRSRGVVAGYTRRAGYYGGIENKFFDLDIDDATIAGGGTIAEDSCNAIAQGTGECNRDGRKCTINAINWRYKISVGSTTTLACSDVVRVILYLDKQANGAAATTTDILESDDYQSFNNLANRKRFKILMDRTHDVNAPGAAGNGTANDSVPYNITSSLYKKCNIPLEYSSTTGAITELRSNNIGVLLLSKNGAYGFESKMRLRFIG